MTEINMDEIRKAIDKLQLKHPCPFSYDATRFESMENISELDRAIDMLSKRMNEDAEINIICEFAKLYLEGVKPMVKPKKEWIPCFERLPEEHGYYLVQTDGSHNAVIDIAEYGKLWSKRCEDFVWEWNKASRVIAWMPLPEPYKEEGDKK